MIVLQEDLTSNSCLCIQVEFKNILKPEILIGKKFSEYTHIHIYYILYDYYLQNEKAHWQEKLVIYITLHER